MAQTEETICHSNDGNGPRREFPCKRPKASDVSDDEADSDAKGDQFSSGTDQTNESSRSRKRRKIDAKQRHGRCKILPSWWVRQNVTLPGEPFETRLTLGSCNCVAGVDRIDNETRCTSEPEKHAINKELYMEALNEIRRLLFTLPLRLKSSPLAAPTVVLESVKDSGIYFLDVVIEQLAHDLGAGLICIDPVDLAEFAADFLREPIWEPTKGSLLQIACNGEESSEANSSDSLLEYLSSADQSDEEGIARIVDNEPLSSDASDVSIADDEKIHDDCWGDEDEKYSMYLSDLQLRRKRALKVLTDRIVTAVDYKKRKSRITGLLHHAPESGVTSNSELGGLILHVRDFDRIYSNRVAREIIERLKKILSHQRRDGKKVLMIGTIPAPTTKEDGELGLELGSFELEKRRFFLDSSTCTKHNQALLEKHRAQYLVDLNCRVIKAIFRVGIKAAREVKLFSPSYRWNIAEFPTLKDKLSTNRLSFNFVRRVMRDLEWKFVAEVPIRLTDIVETWDRIRSNDQLRSMWPRGKLEVTPSFNERIGTTANLAPTTINLEELKKTCNRYEEDLFDGIINPETLTTTFNEVEVSPSTIEALQGLTSLPLHRPDAFNYGVLSGNKMTGALLYGPPGTGKTLLARAIAKEAKATVLEISGADVYQKWVGEGEKMVRAIFSLGRKLSPCVVFIDEGDNVFHSRSKGNTHRADLNVINQFLREWDGLKTQVGKSVIVLVATNRPFDIDTAVLRRLPRRIFLDIPSCQSREKILGIFMRDEQLSLDVNLPSIALATNLYSGSDLKNLCIAAAMECVREEFRETGSKAIQPAAGATSTSNDATGGRSFPKRTLEHRHFVKALAEISSSIDADSLRKIKEFHSKFGQIEVHPHPVAPEVHPHPGGPEVHPHQVAPKVHPHQVAPKVHPHQVAPEVHPHQVAPEVHPHQVAPKVHPHQVAPKVHPHQVAPKVHPHQVAPEVHPHQVAPEVHPHPVATDATPQAGAVPLYYPEAAPETVPDSPTSLLPLPSVPKNEYEYKRLDGFRAVRFIELQPTRNTSPHSVHMKLFHSSLEDEISYCALSYAWGTSDQTEHVICNGQLLSVTPNLLTALSAIRKGFCSKEPLRLWVDAICINQSDNKEKREQVQRMRRIYRGAERVIAWFGEETNNIDIAINLLTKFNNLYEASKDNPGGNVSGLVHMVELPGSTSSDWEALNEFIDRPFSQRIWIVQEIVSAKSCTILSGGTTLDWVWFCEALLGCHLYETDTHPHGEIKGVERILRTENLGKQIRGRTGGDFLDALLCTRGLSSTEPLDKVYAVSSLCDWSNASFIIPDYTIEPKELFPQVVRLLIDSSNSLDVLGAVSPLSITSLSSIEGSDLPSWTPDWTVVGSDLGLLSNRYNAHRHTYPVVREHENPRVLALSGYIVDEAEKLGEKLPHGLFDEISIEHVFRECMSFYGKELGNWDETDFFETQAITMVGGRGPGGEFPMTDSQRRQRVKEYFAWVYTTYSDQFTTDLGEHWIAGASRIDTSNYRHWFDVAFLLNRAMVTSRGYFGVTTLLTEPGDKVCILLGGQMPFILREEGDEWRLVGTAYIHGLMNGEALERDDLELRDFNIH